MCSQPLRIHWRSPPGWRTGKFKLKVVLHSEVAQFSYLNCSGELELVPSGHFRVQGSLQLPVLAPVPQASKDLFPPCLPDMTVPVTSAPTTLPARGCLHPNHCGTPGFVAELAQLGLSGSTLNPMTGVLARDKQRRVTPKEEKQGWERMAGETGPMLPEAKQHLEPPVWKRQEGSSLEPSAGARPC